MLYRTFSGMVDHRIPLWRSKGEHAREPRKRTGLWDHEVEPLNQWVKPGRILSISEYFSVQPAIRYALVASHTYPDLASFSIAHDRG